MKKNLLYYDDQPIYDSDDEEYEDQDEQFNIAEDIPWYEDMMENCPYQYELGIITISYLYQIDYLV